jgi:hypothetical protein
MKAYGFTPLLTPLNSCWTISLNRFSAYGMKTRNSTNVTNVLCLTRTAGVADVVYVNIITCSVGCERVGELAKGGTVVSRPGQKGVRGGLREALSNM